MHIFKVKPCDYSSVLQVSYRLYKTEFWCFLCQVHYIWDAERLYSQFLGEKITLPAKNIFFFFLWFLLDEKTSRQIFLYVNTKGHEYVTFWALVGKLFVLKFAGLTTYISLP